MPNCIELYSAYQNKVIHIQRPIVLKSIDLKLCMTHFLQVFVIGMEDCSECCYWQFRWMSALLFT